MTKHTLSRRSLLGKGLAGISLAATAPHFLGLTSRVFAADPTSDRILVVVQLSGASRKRRRDTTLIPRPRPGPDVKSLIQSSFPLGLTPIPLGRVKVASSAFPSSVPGCPVPATT